MEIQQIHSKQTSTKNLSDCQCDAVILAGIVAAIAFIDAEGDGSAPGRGVIPTLARAEWSLARSSGEVRAGCWAAMDVLR